MSAPHECEVAEDRHEGDVREHVIAGPLWLCARHRRYVGYALDRISVTGEELARAIAVLSGAGKRPTHTDTEPAPPTLRAVRTP
ncbi:hypothetical protein ACWGJ2_11755 [Streptomyces sp. NPDC054796]